MKYYISDLHLFHKNVTGEGNNFDNRPFDTLEEMHKYIKEKWNRKITNGDTVYILGDVALRGINTKLIALVAQLKGNKILIKGNHDDVRDLRYSNLFDEIVEYKEVTDTLNKQTVKLVLSHYPILMWKGQHRGTIHLYGHVHNTFENEFYQECLKSLYELNKLKNDNAPQISAYNVGAMMSYMNYEPRTLQEIVDGCR